MLGNIMFSTLQNFYDTAQCHRASSSQVLERKRCLGENQSNPFIPEQKFNADLQDTSGIDLCSANSVHCTFKKIVCTLGAWQYTREETPLIIRMCVVPKL